MAAGDFWFAGDRDLGGRVGRVAIPEGTRRGAGKGFDRFLDRGGKELLGVLLERGCGLGLCEELLEFVGGSRMLRVIVRSWVAESAGERYQ